MSKPAGRLLPRQASRFGEVAGMLRSGDAAQGFARGAEILLESFELMAEKMGAAVVLKLAIDMHKHALFCDVAQDKTRSQHDAQAYAAFQSYLAGTSDVPVATGINETRRAAMSAGPSVDELEDANDGAQEHEE